jgi:hypothetical protein
MTISGEPLSQTTMQQRDATWQDYMQVRDQADWTKIAFDQGWLWVDRGKEGPNHAAFSDLITVIFGFWVFFTRSWCCNPTGAV